MRVIATRDSVHAGDDADAPHERAFDVAAGADIKTILSIVASSGWLASISGGKASWSVASNIFIGVVAQQWPEPRVMFAASYARDKLDWRDGALHLRFNYHTQIDPEVVFDVLQRARLRA